MSWVRDSFFGVTRSLWNVPVLPAQQPSAEISQELGVIVLDVEEAELKYREETQENAETKKEVKLESIFEVWNKTNPGDSFSDAWTSRLLHLDYNEVHGIHFGKMEWYDLGCVPLSEVIKQANKADPQHLVTRFKQLGEDPKIAFFFFKALEEKRQVGIRSELDDIYDTLQNALLSHEQDRLWKARFTHQR